MPAHKAALLVLSVLGGSVVLIAGGVFYAWRWTRRREAVARTAPIVRAAIAGPMLNRRVAMFALPMLAFAFTMGILTAKGGPIPQSSVWVGVLIAVVLVIGGVGAGLSTMNTLGQVVLDRVHGQLQITIGEHEQAFDLGAPFFLHEFAVPPSPLYPYGGVGIEIRQHDTREAFWYPGDIRTAREPRPPILPGSSWPVRTNGLGRIVHEHLSSIPHMRKMA